MIMIWFIVGFIIGALVGYLCGHIRGKRITQIQVGGDDVKQEQINKVMNAYRESMMNWTENSDNDQSEK